MKKKRKQYTPQQKVMILRKHLVEKVTVSDLCDEYELQPTVFYRWQKAFFEKGSQAFERGGDRQRRQLEGQIAELEAKLAKKNEVLGEVLEEMVALKKRSGAN